MKGIVLLGILVLTLSCHLFAQKNSAEIKVLAKLISHEGGDKIHTSRYLILRNLSDSIIENDTISVEYYGYLADDSITNLKTVLLSLNKSFSKGDFYFCPNYDVKLGIQKAKIENISFEFWRACEEGSKVCVPLNFSRDFSDKNWFLLIPGGGTSTIITVGSNANNFELTNSYLIGKDGEPYLDLSNLKDGNYFANMIACGLGGTVEFNLKTK